MTSKTIPFVCPRATGDGHLGTRYAYAPWATQNMPRGSDRTSEQGSHSLGHMEKNTPKMVTSSYSFPYQRGIIWVESFKVKYMLEDMI